MGLKFRSAEVEDAEWMTEAVNSPEVAKYLITVYPCTEHEVKDYMKKRLKEEKHKWIIAEKGGEPAGSVTVSPGEGRTRHTAWLGIYVRKKCWRQGIGTALMKEAVRVAKEFGIRRFMLGTFEGNERAIGLYKKFGFKTETTSKGLVYLDGGWKDSYVMGLDLAPCEPRITKTAMLQRTKGSILTKQLQSENLTVRQLMDKDLDEVNRLQNCPESTKSTTKIPPITKEATKKWYEELSGRGGSFCCGCFENQKLLGYTQFSGGRLPFANVWVEEILIDMKAKPTATTDSLIASLIGFFERYGYHRIFGEIPETSQVIVKSLEKHGFKKTGAFKGYYFIDDHYVDALTYAYT
ncbi:GNAT family N-acetyltransferase [Candidatus Bathyarchaeota archaeon]|nr:MAG: GNAT family N-acetyltransferase [Candidatus Bathyarchaeota archaeon]